MFFTFIKIYARIKTDANNMSKKEGVCVKKRFLITVLSGIVMGILSGCVSSVINLSDDVVVVPVGEVISTDPADYVRASKSMLSEMTIDVSNVNKDVIGTYHASVKYQDLVEEFYIQVADEKAPEIVLNDKELHIELPATINIDDVIKEISDFSQFQYGFSNDMTLSDKNKTISKSLSFGEEGKYLVEVLAKDEYENYAVEELTIYVGSAGDPVQDTVDYSEYMNNSSIAQLADLESYNSTPVSFGVGSNFDSETNRPMIDYYINGYGDYAVDFIQPDSKYVWLTFNEIAEYGNTEKILDVLKDKNVKAVFFVTLPYVKSNPELVKRMIDEGHILGNYTANCSKVPELSVNNLTNELDLLYNYVYQNYGYEMYLFRTPSGNFNEKALAVAQSKGYRTVFWSFHYADWNVNNQPPVSEALGNAIERVHGGAIYLLSGSSTTNRDMLADMIDGIRDKGYEFAVYQKTNN